MAASEIQNSWDETSAKTVGYPEDMSCEDLMRLVGQERDGSAFELLIQRYDALCRSIIMQVCKDRQSEEDLLQERYLNVWQGASTWDESKGSVSTFIGTIARRRGIDRLRKMGRISAYMQSEESGQIEDMLSKYPSDAPEPIEIIQIEDTLKFLLQNMKQIPENYRDAIAVCCAGHMTMREYAESEGLTLGAVKAYIRRGKQRLLESTSVINEAQAYEVG